MFRTRTPSPVTFVIALLCVMALVASGCGDDGEPVDSPSSLSDAATDTPSSDPAASDPETSDPTPDPTTDPAITAPATTDPPSADAAAVTAADAADATLIIGDLMVDLTDGAASEPLQVRVVGTVIGDVTEDGVDDAVMVVTFQEPGTTGSNSSLLVMHNDGGAPVQTELLTFADRGRTHDLRLAGTQISLRWSERQFFDGAQTHAQYQMNDDLTELALVLESSEPLMFANAGGLQIDATGSVPYGATQAETLAALLPVLGEPDEVRSTPTCWGEQNSASWNDGDTIVWVAFLDDEWFEWGGNDERLGTEAIFVVGAGRPWLEQWLGAPFEMYMNELSGQQQSVEFGRSVSFDPDSGDVIDVGGNWSSDYARLHTVVDNDPDLWCGD